MEVAIVGCGIIGCSTAVAVLERIPNVKLTIVAEHFSPDLSVTSDLAAGFWEPFLLQKTKEEDINKWSEKTYKFLESIIFSSKAAELGVYYIHGVNLFDEPEEMPSWHYIPHGFRRMDRDELSIYGDKFVDGFSFKSIICEGTRFIDYFTKKLKASGVRFVKKKISTFDELSNFDLVVNCTGLGSYDLCNDKLMKPIRGQLIKVHAPFLKEYVLANYTNANIWTYVFPRISDTVIGGTAQQGDWSLETRESDKQMIFDNCCKILPALKSAKVMGHFVGLRPARERVRIEVEHYRTKSGNGKVLPIVHNYGHAGAGLTLFWGCALDASNLVRQHLDTTAKL